MKQPASALTQAFYLSKQFSRLRIETKDYRIHPVLGGISSSRWHAYEHFARKNSLLVDRLTGRRTLPQAVKLSRKHGYSPLSASLQTSQGISFLPHRRARLRGRGFLAGDRRRNRLIGSRRDDVLTGQQGDDILMGGSGNDVLSGGAGADVFLFKGGERQKKVTTDLIVDFDPIQGDRIRIPDGHYFVGSQEFSGRPGEVQAMIWMADLMPVDGRKLQPWMIQGCHLSIDRDGDRRADGFIDIPGLALFESQWLELR